MLFTSPLNQPSRNPVRHARSHASCAPARGAAADTRRQLRNRIFTVLLTCCMNNPPRPEPLSLFLLSFVTGSHKQDKLRALLGACAAVCGLQVLIQKRNHSAV